MQSGQKKWCRFDPGKGRATGVPLTILKPSTGIIAPSENALALILWQGADDNKVFDSGAGDDVLNLSALASIERFSDLRVNNTERAVLDGLGDPDVSQNIGGN